MGARGEFVDEELVGFGDEEFDAEDADDLELFEDGTRDFDGFIVNTRRNARGRDRDVEDVIVVRVFNDAPVQKAASSAPRAATRRRLRIGSR